MRGVRMMPWSKCSTGRVKLKSVDRATILLMLEQFADSFSDLMTRGGVVMWPLMVLSLVSITLCLERGWFWLSTNRLGRHRQVLHLAKLLRQQQTQEALELAHRGHTVYHRVVAKLLSEPLTDALVIDVIESHRPRLERFMPTLSTVITASPMLGILGTVLGIISSFQIIGNQAATGDPSAVSGGIAEALLTTAVGLAVALIVLLPYNAFRAQIDRTLGRMEMLIAAARHHQAVAKDPES